MRKIHKHNSQEILEQPTKQRKRCLKEYFALIPIIEFLNFVVEEYFNF